VVRQESPRIHGPGVRPGQRPEAPHEIPSVVVLSKDRAPLDAPKHAMVEDTEDIEARAAGHPGTLPRGTPRSHVKAIKATTSRYPPLPRPVTPVRGSAGGPMCPP